MRGDGTRLIQAYIGEGKGKTTAAVGQSLRAAGQGYHVMFLQFLKDVREISGELIAIQGIPAIRHAAFGSGKFISRDTIKDIDHGYARDAIDYATAQANTRAMDMLVLDELGAVIELGLVEPEQILWIFTIGEGWLDTVITGRKLPGIILEKADLVTRMELVRHHYDHGIAARRGIEY